MSQDQYLEQYIKKLMERETSFSNPRPLSDEQLKQVAIDTGMTDSDWQKLKKDAQVAKDSGFDHLERNNFQDAILAFQESTALYPNDSTAFYGFAKAKFKASVEKEDKQLLNEALNYVKRSLVLNPNYNEALDLQGYIRNYESKLGEQLVTKSKIGGLKKILIPLLPVVIVVFWLVATYNSTISLEEDVTAAWSQVENVTEARYDKITKLVEVVKSATSQENKILKEVIQARSEAQQISLNSSSFSQEELSQFAATQEQLSASLRSFFGLAEAYPELKSMETYLTLQDEIAGSQNRITVERKRYNEKVSNYNKKVKRFPVNLLPFDEKPYYKVDRNKINAPDLDLP